MIFFFIFVALLLAIMITLLFSILNKQKSPCAFEPQKKKQVVSCQLIDKTKLNHNTYKFKFALPSKEHILGIEVGLHIILQHPNKEELKNQYTPISPVDQKGNFDLLIEIYRDDKNSTNPGLHQLTIWLENMNPGESINVTNPWGKFIYKGNGNFFIMRQPQSSKKKYKRIVMIADGSGIAPLYQIIQAIATKDKDKTQLVLLLANKCEQDILFYSELKAYAALKKLKLHLTLENPPAQWVGFSGSVTENMAEKVFGKLDNQTMALICGPHNMKLIFRNSFQYLGMKDEDIFDF